MSYRPERVPEEVKASLARYVEHRIPTGGFLYAVLTNDLKEAAGRADSENFEALGHIVGYCWNEIPSSCWGSERAVAAWLNPETEPVTP